MNLMLKDHVREDGLKQMQNLRTGDMRRSKNLHNGIDVFKENDINFQKNGVKTDNLFVERNSYLIDVFETSQNCTIYNIFIGMIIILSLNTLIHDVLEHDRIDLGTDLIRSVFDKMDLVVVMWGVMLISSLLPYWFHKQWAIVRLTLYKHTIFRKTWDIFCISCYLVFQFAFLTAVLNVSGRIVFPIASSMIITLEMFRFVMKIHAYVRTVTPRVLNSSSESLTHYPAFSSYLYYAFAPTMLYRDSYPRMAALSANIFSMGCVELCVTRTYRQIYCIMELGPLWSKTKYIQWSFVCKRLSEMAAAIWFLSLLVERFVKPHWPSFGKPNELMTAGQFVMSIFATMVPGILFFVCGFCIVLHSWQNAAAEVLTFADRQFYTDWWNQSSYGAFFRTTNIVIQSWLHVYIFKDMFLLTKNRVLSGLIVIVASATVHEIVLTYAFKIFYPMLFIFFVFIGLLFVFCVKNLNHLSGNIFLLVTLTIGNGVLWSLYSMEYYARKNCPNMEEDGKFVTYPRSWNCHNIAW